MTQPRVEVVVVVVNIVDVAAFVLFGDADWLRPRKVGLDGRRNAPRSSSDARATCTGGGSGSSGDA